ncbi:alpha/beta hydrolase [Thermosynechococcus sp. QKsg1]|uniref:alpha/beta fold hydrolase n=1 Tax=unclassified Thermosynechococcus TaxID=2622553 RepID=UPI00122DF1B9|nr:MULTISPECIES: alpha/beta hydrolase [unclassified Thermosynechococcus]QEQ00821.1 alpha/beta hydrolase [Thermosynechococcus sp. CL-1]WJI25070.1 alpha/beta hydrolase [Thermosynechococcus sp. B0]WJI27598.1 alpha/beta hydrolase [Thermosynechococcus sp. B1]WJI30130.1 alpha/beta hydrolase [Thermosynechococcus sp. B3]WKT84712.1 alpha/beta hydrolase [Thermosynechococcus sp. HY596]
MTEASLSWQHQYLSVNQVRLHYVTQGSGDLVILLHGFPEFWYSWRFQIPVLARHFKVVVPDLRGYNDSEKPAHGYDLDTLSQDVTALIQELGYERAHIVGHDCGGLIAWHVAARFPQRVQHLAVLNTPHPYRVGLELWQQVEHFWRNWPLLACHIPGLAEYWLGHNLQSFLQDLFQRYSIRKAAFSAETVQLYQAALEKAGAIAAVLKSYRHLFSPQQWWHLLQQHTEAITSPTLILWGADDPLAQPSLANGIEAWIHAPWRLKYLPDCGHWAQQEVPGLVNRELLAFLRA